MKEAAQLRGGGSRATGGSGWEHKYAITDPMPAQSHERTRRMLLPRFGTYLAPITMSHRAPKAGAELN
jgi:hypothetical protein